MSATEEVTIAGPTDMIAERTAHMRGFDEREAKRPVFFPV